MVIDTSAIVAIIKEEPGYEALMSVIRHSDTPCYLSTATLLELYMVVNDRQPNTRLWSAVERLLNRLAITIVPLPIPTYSTRLLALNGTAK